MTRSTWLLGAALLLVGCSADPDPHVPPGEGAPPPDFVLGGQTGSGAPPVPCRGDDECVQAAERVLAWFNNPRPVSPLRSSRCADPEIEWSQGQPRFAAGDVCVCSFDCINPMIPGFGWCDEDDPVGEWSVWLEKGHVGTARDRAGVDVLHGIEFDGCDPRRPDTSCEAVCKQFEATWHAASERTYDVKVHNASCPRPHAYPCVTIYEVQDECYKDLGNNFGSEASERGPFECSECAATPEEADLRWLCGEPFCGTGTGRGYDPDRSDSDAGVDCSAF